MNKNLKCFLKKPEEYNSMKMREKRHESIKNSRGTERIDGSYCKNIYNGRRKGSEEMQY
jgi:hypothetical protein